MKRTIWMGTLVILVSCGSPSTPTQSSSTDSTQSTAATETFYGAKITADDAKPVAELKTMMGDQKELAIKVEGPIESVCQKKGCWMDLKTTEGESMRVTFKDYGFFMPKDAAGKTAIVEGIAKVEETSVADLKEYAKDAGKTQEEIDAIKTPKQELVFEASGVILK